MTVDGADPRAVRAAAANVSWCETVCRAHGTPGTVATGVWRAGGEPPPFYPDVVTLHPGLRPADVAGVVPDRHGAAVKDSFADLDLRDHGFAALFEAQWIWREPSAPVRPGTTGDGATWSEVTDEVALGEWGRASGQPGTFTPTLLADPAVRFLVAHEQGEAVGRAALCLAAGVAGVSNVWAGGSDVWHSLGGAVAGVFPRAPLAGYEQGVDLARAVKSGFEPVGRLRVWVRP